MNGFAQSAGISFSRNIAGEALDFLPGSLRFFPASSAAAASAATPAKCFRRGLWLQLCIANASLRFHIVFLP